ESCAFASNQASASSFFLSIGTRTDVSSRYMCGSISREAKALQTPLPAFSVLSQGLIEIIPLRPGARKTVGKAAPIRFLHRLVFQPQFNASADQLGFRYAAGGSARLQTLVLFGGNEELLTHHLVHGFTPLHTSYVYIVQLATPVPVAARVVQR